MYTGQVTVPQSKLSSFLKTAQSLKIRGLVNSDQFQDEFLPNSDSCIPLRKRRRSFSADNSHTFNVHSKDHVRPTEGPTDLSLPKPESEVCFQPVIQAVSYSAVDPANTNHSNKIYLKPKEALISPSSSDVSDCSDKPIREQVHFKDILHIFFFHF